MGCTSSAQNMSDVHSHTTENEKRENNDDIKDNDMKKMDTNEEKDSEQAKSTIEESNEIKMLPTCDNLHENLQLDSKECNSEPDIVNNEQETNISDDGNDTEVNVNMEIEEKLPCIESQEEALKCLSFGNLVEQVVADSILDDSSVIPIKEDDTQNDEKPNEENLIPDNSNELKNTSTSEELEGINHEEANYGDISSPSQSECSRATRWEALADIAAELPPSLAVDPLTGQIFSLTK